MANIDNIIIHCSDSGFGCVREIRKWHRERGWRDIGYHFVIQNGYPIASLYLHTLDGSVECGRYLDENLIIDSIEQGAHALGYNSNSIGICLIGRSQFSLSQIKALISLCEDLVHAYKIDVDNIIGHNETESGKAQGKTCPNFDVKYIREYIKRGLMI